MKAVKIAVQGPSERRFSKEYLEKLAIVLSQHLSAVTGMRIDGKRWFMFHTTEPVQELEQRTFSWKGDIVGPDSFAHDAEILWGERDNGELQGGWRRLKVRALQRKYGVLQPAVLPVGLMPFEVDWIPFWESHLPEDFYVVVSFDTGPIDSAVEGVRNYLRALEVEYESVKGSDRLLDVHVGFGSKASVEDQIVEFVHFLKSLHDRFPIQKLQIGAEG